MERDIINERGGILFVVQEIKLAHTHLVHQCCHIGNSGILFTFSDDYSRNDNSIIPFKNYNIYYPSRCW